MKEVRIFVLRCIFLIVFFGIFFGCIFGLCPMKSMDMFPKLGAGDLILFYRLEKNYGNGDLVVVRKNGETYVLRVVAVEGDCVEITEEARLKVNESIVIENDIFYKTPMYETDVSYPIQLKDQEYFLLGDHREGARDSRFFGSVKKSEIRGKVIGVLRRTGL